MSDLVAILRDGVDGCVLVCLFPLAVYILLSGIDDLFIDVIWLIEWAIGRFAGRRRVVPPAAKETASVAEKSIAIFVPLWRESAVIGDMLAHNIAAVKYSNYTFFAGAYPNDAETIAAVNECASRLPNVRLAICPHDGPTSKADCLNWIYQRMLQAESENGRRFDLVVTHDAEDMIHPSALKYINYYAEQYDFVQVPVLPLRTSWDKWTHGVYCDEFAEFQSRDLPVRQALGGFIPSAGVGTGYSRRALEALAATEARIFEPSCLTEDYENGYHLHSLGFRQVFIPLSRIGELRTVLATREYFPQTIRSAVRQRTRWITGIALQTWQRHGWRGSFRQKYWLWRDRKSLVGNPASLLANLIGIYTLTTGFWSRASLPDGLAPVIAVTFALQMLRLALRAGYVARLYGVATAAMTPLRVLLANSINALAAFGALWQFGYAMARRMPVPWLKTEHAYPSRESLIGDRRKLGEILVASGVIEAQTLQAALASQPAGVRIGEHLVSRGELTEAQLYLALSVQQGFPVAGNDASSASSNTVRALPATVARRLKVLPFRIVGGVMHVATPEPPDAKLTSTLQTYTSLQLRFHLITPTAFRELARAIGGTDRE